MKMLNEQGTLLKEKTFTSIPILIFLRENVCLHFKALFEALLNIHRQPSRPFLDRDRPPAEVFANDAQNDEWPRGEK